MKMTTMTTKGEYVATLEGLLTEASAIVNDQSFPVEVRLRALSECREISKQIAAAQGVDVDGIKGRARRDIMALIEAFRGAVRHGGCPQRSNADVCKCFVRPHLETVEAVLAVWIERVN
jgi:hypothetical protein